MPQSRMIRVLVASAVAALVLSACGSDGSDGDDAVAATSAPNTTSPADIEVSVPPNGEVVEVLTLDNNYRPEDIEIVAGTAVVWNNGGRNDHNIIPVDDTQDWGVDIEDFEPGEVYEHVFTTPGTYRYYCTLHGTATAGMIGSVIVTG